VLHSRYLKLRLHPVAWGSNLILLNISQLVFYVLQPHPVAKEDDNQRLVLFYCQLYAKENRCKSAILSREFGKHKVSKIPLNARIFHFDKLLRSYAGITEHCVTGI